MQLPGNVLQEPFHGIALLYGLIQGKKLSLGGWCCHYRLLRCLPHYWPSVYLNNIALGWLPVLHIVCKWCITSNHKTLILVPIKFDCQILSCIEVLDCLVRHSHVGLGGICEILAQLCSHVCEVGPGHCSHIEDWSNLLLVYLCESLGSVPSVLLEGSNWYQYGWRRSCI